jgi:hypothetical protein
MKKITKLISNTIIRVKFKRITGGFYRPARIRKYEYETKVYEDEERKILKTSYPAVVYKPYLPMGSEKEIDPKTFITGWKKGETPQPKRKDKNKAIQGKRRGHKKGECDNIIKMTQESIRIARQKHRAMKNQRKLKSANSKNGTITIDFIDEKGDISTKTFPSKNLMKNQEFKKWALAVSIKHINFKRKRGDKDAERVKSELAKKAHKDSPKYEAKRAKRRAKFEALVKKAVEHAKTKGKVVTNSKMKVDAKPHKELEWDEIKKLNKKKTKEQLKEEALVQADTNLKEQKVIEKPQNIKAAA